LLLSSPASSLFSDKGLSFWYDYGGPIRICKPFSGGTGAGAKVLNHLAYRRRQRVPLKRIGGGGGL